MPSYSVETKIQAVKLYNVGLGSTTIAHQLGINQESTILRWIHLWNKYGLKGLKRPNKLPIYSASFKMKVIIWMVRNKASYPQTAKHFDISNEGTVWTWKHRYDVCGNIDMMFMVLVDSLTEGSETQICLTKRN